MDMGFCNLFFSVHEMLGVTGQSVRALFVLSFLSSERERRG